MISTAVGDWNDVSKAQAAAQAQANTGVDYWMECGEGPALGAIKEAEQSGGYVTGYVGDMSMAPGGSTTVLASIQWNLVPLFNKMIADTNAGTFDNPWYSYGVKDNVLQITYNPALKSKIPAAALAAVNQALQDISSGKLTVPYVPQAPK